MWARMRVVCKTVLTLSERCVFRQRSESHAEYRNFVYWRLGADFPDCSSPQGIFVKVLNSRRSQPLVLLSPVSP